VDKLLNSGTQRRAAGAIGWRGRHTIRPAAGTGRTAFFQLICKNPKFLSDPCVIHWSVVRGSVRQTFNGLKLGPATKYIVTDMYAKAICGDQTTGA